MTALELVEVLSLWLFDAESEHSGKGWYIIPAGNPTVVNSGSKWIVHSQIPPPANYCYFYSNYPITVTQAPSRNNRRNTKKDGANSRQPKSQATSSYSKDVQRKPGPIGGHSDNRLPRKLFTHEDPMQGDKDPWRNFSNQRDTPKRDTPNDANAKHTCKEEELEDRITKLEHKLEARATQVDQRFQAVDTRIKRIDDQLTAGFADQRTQTQANTDLLTKLLEQFQLAK